MTASCTPSAAGSSLAGGSWPRQPADWQPWGWPGLVGYEWPHTAKRSVPDQPDYQALSEVQGFVTRPDLRPPVVRVTTLHGHGSRASEYDRPRHIFVSPITLTKAPSQPGLMVLDGEAGSIWLQALHHNEPLRLQRPGLQRSARAHLVAGRARDRPRQHRCRGDGQQLL